MADNFWNINFGVRLTPQGSAPSNPRDGDLYYDNSLGKLRVRQGGAWIALSDSDGTVLLADGSVGSPSLSFTNDTDTGIYRPGSGQLVITTDAGESMRFASGAARAQDGSAGGPSYSFNSDPDSGFYRSGSGNLAISIDGVQIANFNAAQSFRASLDGSAANPTFTFVNDADNGIYLAGTNTIGFSTSGTARLAIGTGAIQAQSGVVYYGPNGTTGAPLYSFTNDPDTGMYLSSVGVLALVAGGAQQLEVTGGAIVTKAPIYALGGSAAAPGIAFELSTDMGLYRASGSSLSMSVAGAQVQNWQAAESTHNTHVKITGQQELRLNNSGNTFYTAVRATNPTANYIISLPSAAPADNTFLKHTTGGAYVWDAGGGGGGDINNGGNATGADITIGTNDAFSLQFETNAVVKGSISSAGLWTIGASGGTEQHVVNGSIRVGAAIGGTSSFNSNSSSVYTLWVNNANTTNTAPGLVVVVGQTTAAGGTSNALAVYNNAGGAGGDLVFNVSGAGALQLGQIGGAKTHNMYSGDSDTLGSSINLNTTSAANTFGIVKDGSTGRLRIAGGGSTNGTHAMLSLYGNAHASLPGRISFDNVVGTVFSATNTGLVTIGPAASTVSHAVNGHLGITRTVSIGDSAPGTQIALHIQNTNRILTATSQYGQYTNHYTSSAATSAIYGHYLDINTPSVVHTTPFVASYVAGAINKGSGHTITRIAAYLSTVGTGNAANSAVLADNTTFSSDWFISNTVNQNTTFALPSTFAGHMGLGGAIDNSTMLNITGGGVSFQADQRAAIAALTSTAAATTSVVGFLSRVTNTAGAYTVGARIQFDGENPTKGAGSTITRDVGMRLTPPDDGASNALISDNLSFSGDWSLNITSQRKSVIGGVLGVGTTSPDVALYVGVGNVLFNSATQLYGVLSDGRFPTTATDTAFGFVSSVSSFAAAYTVDKVYGFYAQNPAKGAGSTITRQMQFSGVQPSQGTHNAFLSDSATFSGTYFIHQAGGSASSFAGPVSFVGQTLLQDGTANNPALRWINGNSSQGLYRISDSEVRFTFPDTSIVSISNQGSNDDSVLKLTNTGSSSGDQYVYFIEGALTASQWSIGRDDSDSGSFVISQASSPGTNNVFKINPSQLVTIGSNQSFTVDNGSASFGYSRSASGSNIRALIENTSNTADSGAILQLNVAGSSGGDTAVNFQIVGEQQFTIGIDNTDNNFKVSSGSALGSSDYLIVTNDAAVQMAAGTGDQAGLTGLVYSDTSERATVGTGEDDLGTYTMPANTMRHNGDVLEICWSGTTLNNNNGKQLRVYLGTASADLSTGSLTLNSDSWEIRATLTRTSSGIIKGIVRFMSDDQTNGPMMVKYIERAVSYTGSLVFKLTGEATADGDIVNRNTMAWFNHANP